MIEGSQHIHTRQHNTEETFQSQTKWVCSSVLPLMKCVRFYSNDFPNESCLFVTLHLHSYFPQ